VACDLADLQRRRDRQNGAMTMNTAGRPMLAKLPPHTQSLADKLGELRQRSGLSFDKLAERSFTNVSYLHALESGKKARPSRDILIRIGFGLGVDPELIDDMLITAGHLPLFEGPRLK